MILKYSNPHTTQTLYAFTGENYTTKVKVPKILFRFEYLGIIIKIYTILHCMQPKFQNYLHPVQPIFQF